MKNQSHSNLIVRSGLALGFALFVLASVQAQSDTPADAGMMKDSRMMNSHPTTTASQQTMMQHHQAMMADMKSQDAELAAQVAKMNSAPADKKLDLMAAIITRMVEQRTAMNARIGMMREEMMNCSMQNMSMGARTPSSQPMMNDMNGKMEDAKK